MALYPLLRPLVFGLDAERAHGLTRRALKALPAGKAAGPDPALAIKVAGLDFPNPISGTGSVTVAVLDARRRSARCLRSCRRWASRIWLIATRRTQPIGSS